MHLHVSLTWSWLHCLTKKRYDALKKVYGNLDTALEHLDEEMLQNLGCKEETIVKTLHRSEEFSVEQYQAELEKRKLSFLSIEDHAYPTMLHDLPDPPLFLYYYGDLAVLDQPCIGLVGTRKISSYGKRVAEEFARASVHSGMVTVSGLAQGIDAVVAQETVHTGGKTVAVLGHGLAQIFPSNNRRLAKQIVATGGVLLTEFPLDTTPGRHTFPARNRIIAGLSLGTVVLEAPEKSGAILTAEFALEYGREVFAVPGQIFDENYAGCHALIGSGQAKLVCSPQDVFREIGIVSSPETPVSSYEAKSHLEEKILEVLTTMPQPVDNIALRTVLPSSDVNATLTMLEIAGVVKNTGGGQWVKK
ncbi:DNA protecting protein DprA [Candidatus Peribacteria bacterium RIFCSPHIGHO2_02_FULL_49_16]|nr:MAG: DNA protecting protein DprA [Candidatus Peribacteria bacterium RIFCSPHIGHO2_01_FULL_49_38]OGJ59164.1 MAG: DNA protecting protein DprA [Candidatus Peribacteria bacterium RIFCSPHIGHO2_02_FULL_49_16]